MQALPFIVAAGALGGGYLQGRAAEQAAQAESKTALENAERVKLEGGIEANRRRRLAMLELGQQRANVGKSGIAPAATLDLLAENAAQLERDVRGVELATTLQATGFGRQAKDALSVGTRARQAARIKGVAGAGYSLLPSG